MDKRNHYFTLNCLTKMTIFIVMTLLLYACSSERTANIENFRNALNQKFHLKKQKMCFSDIGFRFPVAISNKEKSTSQLMAKLNALTSAGLVHRKKIIKQLKRNRRGINMGFAFNYRLTGSGYEASKRVRTNKKWVRKFCYANSHANKIISFSQPKTLKNKTTTQVVYSLTLTKVAKWARGKKFLTQFPQVKKHIDLITQPVQHKATLQLGKERWIIQ
ncbi:hypothetical protein MNBD_GAMMA12-709 [hydrothermal vent metagenome]|uniref:Uncharacterized protein n=1 Tax=hydrothermal vent metagenome TaxID=652676 RepID=A0A3B0Z2D9_9ZZZZ